MNWKNAFDAVETALGVISSAGSTPGINLIPYVGVVSSAAGTLKLALDTGVKVAPYVVALKNTFSGGLPTTAELAVLDAKIGELRAIVHAPLPPKEYGEED